MRPPAVLLLVLLLPLAGALPPPVHVPEPSQGVPQFFGRDCENLGYLVGQVGEGLNGYYRDDGFSVAASPDGTRIAIAGDSYTPGDASTSDYVILAYDAATGDRLWVTRYDGPAHGQDHPYSVAWTPDGATVLATGWSRGVQTGYDYGTIAIDAATGAIRWVAREDGPMHDDDNAWTVRATPDGQRVLVTGFSMAEDTLFDYLTVAYDAHTGARLWSQRHDGSSHLIDWPYLLAISPDGQQVVVEGWELTSGSVQDWATVSYDVATGREMWVARESTPLQDIATDVTFTPDGRSAIVTGWTTGSTGSDFLTVAYDAADGARRWAKTYDGPGHGLDLPLAVRVTGDGQRVIVSGSSMGAGTALFDQTMVAYSASTGAPQWVQRYDGGYFDFGIALALGNGSAYLTGCSQRLATVPVQHLDYDVATMAVDDRTGAVRWVTRFDGRGGGGDAGWSVDVVPGSGDVAVTGWSEGVNSGYDTLARVYTSDGALRWSHTEDAPR